MANYIKVDGANYKIQGKGALGGIATVQMPNIASDQTYTFPSIGGQLALEGKNKLFAGVGDKPTVTGNLDGTLTVGNDGTYYLYSDATGESVIDSYTINGATYTPTDGVLSYIVANYNSGTPALQLITNVSLINETTIIPVLTVYRDGTDLHLVDWDSLGWALVNKIHQSIVKTQRVRRESGLTLSEATGRKIICSAGRVWIGAVPKDLDAIDSSVDPTTLFYHSSGNWTSTAITAYDNTQYDNGTYLATLTNNSYGVNFVYRCVSDTHGDHTYVVLGQGDYDLNEAQAAQPPSSLPPLIASMGILVGRIIVQKSAATATQIDSAFVSTFSGTGAVDHNATTGLQGGTAAEYYHLTSAQHTGLTALYGGTGTLSIPDANLSVVGSVDATKIAKFEVDGFTTGTTRTVTLPNADIVAAGSAVALTSGRIPTATTGGLLTDTFIASTVSGNTATFAGAMGAARVFTLPDASITVAGSATALTATRVPFVTTGGLLTDSANLTFDGDTLTIQGAVPTVYVGATAPPGVEQNTVYIKSQQMTGSTAGRALNVECHYAGSYAFTGMQTAAYIEGANDINHAYGHQSWSYGDGSGTVTAVAGFMAAATINSGAWTDYYGYLYKGATVSGGAIARRWAFFGESPDPSYLSGKLAISAVRLTPTAIPQALFVSNPFTSGTFGITLAQAGIYSSNDAAVGSGGAIALGGKTGLASDPYPAAFVFGGRESLATYAGYFSIYTTSGGGGGETNSANYERLRVSSTGVVSVFNTQASTSTTTGCATFAGGIGVAGAAYVGGNLVTTGSITASGGQLVVGAAALAANPALTLVAAAGQIKDFNINAGSAGRWTLRCSADTGSEGGGDLTLIARTDAGAFIDNAVSIVRASGGTITLGGTTSRTLSTTGGRIEKLSTITTSTTLDATYHNVLCNSASALTVTLPAAASNSGRVYVIKNINTGTVTVDGNASETIDGDTTYALTQYQSIKILCNGSNWFIVT